VERRGALARAEADLAQGRTHSAIQRLRSLLAADPGDPVVRSRLAAAYRSSGNLVEAGRWAYLTEDLIPEEEAAFLRAYPSPWLRLRVLRFVGSPDSLGPQAGERLRRLVVSAHLTGPPRTPGAVPPFGEVDQRHGTLVPCLFVVVTMLVATALAVIGAVRLWDWWQSF
jgi:hypothetical protein